jgi:hypothetical protein
MMWLRKSWVKLMTPRFQIRQGVLAPVLAMEIRSRSAGAARWGS